MSYALSGSTPSPIPSANTPDARDFEVGSYVMGFLGPGVPWLDANLIVRNVTADQAARQVRDVIRSALTVSGATVDDVRWVEGGFVHARWRPNSARSAVEYATSVRDALLQAAQALGPRSQIVMTRFRVDMPTGRTNLYVYPIGAPPPPPPPTPGAIAAPSAESSVVTEEESSGSTLVVGIAAVGVLAMLGGVGYYLSKRPVRRNRRRRRSR